MMTTLPIDLRPFHPADQPAVRALILEGLAARFGVLREDLNPDVNNIEAHYLHQGSTFLVAEADNQIVGCGALIAEHGSTHVARIVRVSVHPHYQQNGIGRTISQRLIKIAGERGFRQILVETNEDWQSALRLYQSLGFQEVFRHTDVNFGYVEIHMALNLLT